jgi:hypothetical protein
MIDTDAISFSADGLRISQVLPRRAAAAVLRFPGPRSRTELVRRREAAQ